MKKLHLDKKTCYNHSSDCKNKTISTLNYIFKTPFTGSVKYPHHIKMQL
ncbi:MAG: hypothetical protein QG673_40 [Pseudomonadota bacterium]|nr:hypothetical protein [Pseudomonadota bacterium]